MTIDMTSTEADTSYRRDLSTPAWPYPALAEPAWLGGATATDPALRAAIRAVRTALAETGVPADASSVETVLAAMGVVSAVAERLDWALLSLVGEARAEGTSWTRIGNALGVSKQAAQQRFAPWVRQAHEQAARSADTQSA